MTMASRGFVLTFHSHNISGNTYETNDHVALDETLTLLEQLRIPVVRMLEAVRRLRRGSLDTLPERFACLTFDDGSDYDWRELEFPGHGRQRSMRAILRAHSTKLLGLAWRRRAHATTFVIASGDARREIAASALGDPGLMTDGWWRAAQASGLMDVGTGLFTRDVFAAHLSRLAKASQTTGRPLSICVLRIADSPDLTRARAGGWIDRATPQIGSMIGRLVRTEDTAARLAPEVFALALPATPGAAARASAERISAVIACTAFESGEGNSPFVVDFDIGVAQVEPGEPAGRTLERAAAQSLQKKAG